MDIKDLRSRIDSIKKQSPETKPVRPDAGAILAEHGWTKIADMVYEKVSVIKNILPQVISNTLLDADSQAAPASQFSFYDTETTGLSAGAGNMVFLAGFGFTEASASDINQIDFKIVQLFLSDFPGEPAFLERMNRYITPDRIYVSYNGKSFDANILRTRYAMNAMHVDFGYQLDLLYSSRRLWKNVIGSCSLGDIEREVLDKRRAVDVPGFMVPDLYFDFIRSGRWDEIEGVLAHHLEDITSLAELLNVHEQLFDAVGSPDTAYCDPLGLASLLTCRQPEKAAVVLENSFKSGNYKAGVELSLIHKRAGRWDEAVVFWQKLWSGGKSIFAAVELAKYWEHREHKIEKAYSITCDLLSLEQFRISSHKEELNKRKARLKSKLLI